MLFKETQISYLLRIDSFRNIMYCYILSKYKHSYFRETKCSFIDGFIMYSEYKMPNHLDTEMLVVVALYSVLNLTLFLSWRIS